MGLRLRRSRRLPPGPVTSPSRSSGQVLPGIAAADRRSHARDPGVLCLRAERAWPDDAHAADPDAGRAVGQRPQRRRRRLRSRVSEAFTGAVLAALPGETAIIDSAGVIVQVNEAWARFARTAAGDAARHDRRGRRTISPPAAAPSACPPRAPARPSTSSTPSSRGNRRRVRSTIRLPRGRRSLVRDARALLARPGGRRRDHALRHQRPPARRGHARRHLSQVAHMDRVSAMGELASSLAHELNQPLTAILSNAQAAQPLPRRRPRLTSSELLRVSRRTSPTTTSAPAKSFAGCGGCSRRPTSSLRRSTSMIVVAERLALVANDALLHRVSIEAVPAPARCRWCTGTRCRSSRSC